MEDKNEMNNENDEAEKNEEELVHWEPVSKDPYEYASDEVKRYHEEYIKMWNIKEHKR